jgi:predicted amidohydrolase YtcJ
MTVYADLILYDGEVVSVDEQENIYEAIAVKDEKIIGLGTSNEILQLKGDSTEVINLKGKTALPGLIDSHQHFFATGAPTVFVNCDLPSIKEVVNEIKKHAKNMKPDEWIIGVGYRNTLNLLEKRKMTKWDFTEIKNPLFIMSRSYHEAVVNEPVLQKIGIKDDTVIEGGIIDRDENGEATGVLKEEAMQFAKGYMPPISPEILCKAAKVADSYNIKNGITSIHEPGLGLTWDGLNEFKILQKMTMEKLLNVRIYAMIWEPFFEEIRNAKLLNGFGNDRLKLGSIKMFSDGALGMKTAAISEPYVKTDSRGLLNFSQKELEKKVIEAHKEGFQVAIHAMGDTAVASVLRAFEKALSLHPNHNHRHRIEHATITKDEHIKKMKELGVIPLPTMSLFEVSGNSFLENVPSELIKYIYPNRKLIKNKLKPSLNSDSPCGPISPMLGIYIAMTRKIKDGREIAPEEKVTLYEAIKMYTINSAYASFDENKKGSLEIGKLGDIVILPKGFLNFTAEQVRDTEVEMTIVGGEIVYSLS